MRRHAEGLVILSGSPTVRAWDQPVDAEDVARAAVAEVEDYTRVEVAAVSSGAVRGAVVADVIHLLAELIENATGYSPPATEVTVRIERVANGLAVEVVDRGVGLHPDELAELNRRLAEAVEFDLADDTDRLGLFVVSRLAARHGVKVVLQPSPYGGTTAVVLLPNELLAAGAGDVPAAGPPPVEAPHRSGRRLDRPDRPAATAAPVPAAASPPRQKAPPRQEAAPLGAPAGERPPGGAVPGEAEPSERTGLLPKRVRQRNLAPQLRGRPQGRHAAGAGAPGAAGEPADDEPDPEAGRALMASLQAGWMRGREEDEPDDPDDPTDDDGPGGRV
ncbi:sensor histidine kinase [Actinomadura sp. WAC 06369]|uniref:sensor histidine kinase n=1 Tax=Actinomadura sp. WAC 06369 TaxID=2203193 RepID=UPI000F7A20FB|nr:ATP-binding protein [Actinomadura sp. WAC 06369]RSN50707.1 hypothetical protein DMH08_32250 [Actinomadura sp. WAC 06369]